jgi:uncharacterized protein
LSGLALLDFHPQVKNAGTGLMPVATPTIFAYHVDMLDAIRESTLVPVLEKKKAHIAFGYVFGSVARGEALPLSDLDIAVFLRKPEEVNSVDFKLDLTADLCRKLQRNDIDVVILNYAKNLILIEEIIREGVVIFDQDLELREDFEQRVLHQSIDFRRQRRLYVGV